MELFELYEWLKYYFDASDFLSEDFDTAEYEEKIKKSLEDFYGFFIEFSELSGAWRRPG